MHVKISRHTMVSCTRNSKTERNNIGKLSTQERSKEKERCKQKKPKHVYEQGMRKHAELDEKSRNFAMNEM